MTPARLLSCVSRDWQPGLDLGPTGWVTIAACLACAGLAVAVVRRHGRAAGRRFWIGMAGLLLALAVGRLLDLPAALTAAGRCLARAQGWYERRGEARLAFVVTLALLAALAIAVTLTSLRGRIAANRLALAGLALVLGAAAARAAGFHPLDRFPGSAAILALDVAGLALIAVNAALHLRRPARAPHRRRRRHHRHGSRGRPRDEATAQGTDSGAAG